MNIKKIPEITIVLCPAEAGNGLAFGESRGYFFMTYEEQLQTPEWKEKRQRVIDHYWGMCFKCCSTKRLEVHHRYYVNDGRMAWEYPMSALIPLCHDCHQLEHNKVPERQPVRTIQQVMVEWLEGLLKLQSDAKKIH